MEWKTDTTSASWWPPARLVPVDGKELRGTELGPEFSIGDGSFEAGLDLSAQETLPPRAADRFYRALEKRYYSTDLGMRAAVAHGFPPWSPPHRVRAMILARSVSVSARSWSSTLSLPMSATPCSWA